MILPGMYASFLLLFHVKWNQIKLTHTNASYANTLLVLLNNRARPASPYAPADGDADNMYVSDGTTARGSNNTRTLGSANSNTGFNLGPFIAALNNRGSAQAPLEPFAAAPRGEVSWGTMTMDIELELDEVRLVIHLLSGVVHFLFFLSLFHLSSLVVHFLCRSFAGVVADGYRLMQERPQDSKWM